MQHITRLTEYVAEGRLFEDHRPDRLIQAYIPPMGRENHASNLIELKNGDILCTWFAGLSEGSEDIKIALSRLPKGADRWTQPVLVSDDYTRSEQNPALFEAPDGRLWLLHTAQCSRGQMTHQEWYEKVARGEVTGHFSMQETAEVRVRYSDDHGVTWSDYEALFTKPGAFCRHPITVLSNGDWAFPMWYSLVEEDASKPQYGRDYSVVQLSSDLGVTWTEVAVPQSERRVHMTVTEIEPGYLVALFRSRSADRIYRAESRDNGRSWTAPVRTQLPNNNASIQAIKLQSGSLAVIYNAYSAGDDPEAVVWPGRRTPVNIALSDDGGLTFPFVRTIQHDDGFIDPDHAELNSRHHYPSIMQSRDGMIHVSYSYHGRECIFYQRFSEAWLRGETVQNGG